MDGEKMNTILIVDDERSNISVLRNILKPDYTVYAATDGLGAIEAAEKFVPDIILLDIVMPDMDGYETLSKLKENTATQNIPVMFITGLDNTEAEEKGLLLGAVDYIPKPFKPAIVGLRVSNLIKLINHARELVEQATVLRLRTEKLLRLQSSMASVLASMVENRDKLTGRHIEQTAAFVKILLEAMVERGVYADDIKNWSIEMLVSSSRLHDIGKIVVSDLILNKPGKLTEDEYKIIKTHSGEGERIISDIIAESGDEDFLHFARLFAGNHHEKWDGTGYPRGLKGLEIPLPGRIMAVADVYDALVSERPYKKAFSHEKAVEIILEGKENHFDPEIVDIFHAVNALFKDVI
ncbi:MAG: response regulator [Defluviitaleaceae bacterium]|nr:response regulator [Defluviitaleaceae bacterium]